MRYPSLPIMLLILLAPFSLPAHAQSTQPAPRFTLSKETTIITTPLLPDGRPDYLRALNDRYSQGITPENNAAIPLLKIIGPQMLPEEGRDQTYKALGIEPLPQEGNYLTDEPNDVSLAIKDAIKKSWNAEEYPAVAQWLIQNQQTLPALAPAVAKPRFHVPLSANPQNGQEFLSNMRFLSFARLRALADAALAQGTLRLNQGDVAGYQTATLSSLRLSRLLKNQPTLIERLVAFAVERITYSSITNAAASEKLDVDTCRRFLDGIAELPQDSPFAECFDMAERWYSLDFVLALASADKTLLNRLLESSGENHGLDSGFLKLNPDSVNWDLILRNVNGRFDEVVNFMKNDNWPVASQAAAAFDKRSDEFCASVDKEGPAWIQQREGEKKDAYTQRIAEALNSMSSLKLAALKRIELLVAAEQRGMLLCLRLAIFHRINSEYPPTLEVLQQLDPATPLPLDPFSNKPFLYHRTPTGFTLYSVGPDTTDDNAQPLDKENKGDLLIYPPK